MTTDDKGKSSEHGDAPAKHARAERPKPTYSDEGVPFQWIDAHHFVNVSRITGDARRVSLHVNGKTYNHVSEDAEGRWVYRFDC